MTPSLRRRPGLAQRMRQTLARWIAPSAGAGAPSLRRFEAARLDRLTSGWLATESSINEELRHDLNRLRARGRDLVKNNDYARKFVGMCQTNIVGPDGFRLQVRIEDKPGSPDRLANAAIETAFAQWSAACDLTGTQSLRDICATLIGGLPSDGEFLVRFVRGPDARNRFNFAIQPIDVDRIDTSYTTAAVGSGNKVVMGVEQDASGRPLALHLFDAHPSDGPNTSRQRIRVPIDDLLHRFRIDTPAQARGIPWMAPGMLSLHHLGSFKLAALLAAEHGANHFGFFTSPDGGAPLGAPDETGQPITTTQPGTFDTLPAGVSFQAFDSKYPEAYFGPFVKTTLQRIASGWRVAYHSLANDLEGVSFSSIRSGTLEERDRWADDQAWFISSFLEPLYAVWLQQSLLSGAITMPNGSALPAAKIDKFSAHEWQPRRWDWVDPKNDMEAKILSVRAGLIAPQDLAAQMGYDFEDTLAKIKSAQDTAARFGISLTAYDATPGATPGAAPAGAAADPAAAKMAELIDLQRAQHAAQAQQASHTSQALATLGAALQTLPAQRQAEPITVALSTRELEASFAGAVERITDATLSRLNDMPIIVNVPEQPAPVVNVAAPVVHVAAPEVTVEATVPEAQVVINHPAIAVQTIERDAQGDIARTTTSYA